MYIPKEFHETNAARLGALMSRHGFALLTTVQDDGVPFTSHLPFVFEPSGSGHGVLHGHMARANPQWRHFENGGEVLVVFWGPHAYVSPSWYATHPAVPTWNYATVHAYGRPRMIEDPVAKRATMAALVKANEAGFEAPWRLELPEQYEARMLRGIVTFEIPQGRVNSHFSRFLVTNLTDENDVGVLAQNATQRAGKCEANLGPHFYLAYARHLVFDWVFHGDDVDVRRKDAL